MITLVLLAQLAQLAQLAAGAPHDTATYSSAAVRALVTEAARLNGLVPPSLGRYRATLESEVSFGSRDGGGKELAVSIEQMASDLTWARTGDFEQHVTGYRSQAIGPQLATLGFFRYPWAVPSLYGNRLALLFGRDTTRRGVPPGRGGGGRAANPPERLAGERVSGPRNPQGTTYAVHPLASDRERVYRFSGGDTVESLKVGDREIRIVKLDVSAKEPLPPRTTVFIGEIDLDAERKHVVRMRGSFATTTERPSGPFGVFAALQLEGAIFVELVNIEVNQEYWLLSYQRFDFQAMAATMGESKAVFRIVSRFRNYAITRPESTVNIAATDTLRPRPHVLSIARSDSLARFGTWREELGVASASVSAEDFNDVAPKRWRPDGPPLVRFQAERLSDLARFNRVEELFTGLGASVRMRDAAPGLTVRATGGYAWSEHSVRGRASVTLVRGEWSYTAKSGRSLDITNDFRNPSDSGATLGPLLGVDEYDYVDRYSAGVAVAHALARRRAIARLEVGWADDRVTVEHLTRGPFGGAPFLANRGVTTGQYLRSAITLQWHPDASAEFMRPGFGGQLSYLRGDGELNFQRAELTLSTRRNVGRWTFASRFDAGVVLGTPPPQQLFELGRELNLPGYEYKEFEGNQAAVLRGIVMYRLNLLQAPVRLTQRIWLPAVAPALSVAAQSGWTGASGEAAREAISALGTRAVVDPIGAAPYVPASRVTGNARASVSAGIRIFGGAIGLSLSRAVDHAAPWAVRLEFGQEF